MNERLIRLAPYNREFIILGRWRLPYAPAYGWRDWLDRRRGRK